MQAAEQNSHSGRPDIHAGRGCSHAGIHASRHAPTHTCSMMVSCGHCVMQAPCACHRKCNSGTNLKPRIFPTPNQPLRSCYSVSEPGSVGFDGGEDSGGVGVCEYVYSGSRDNVVAGECMHSGVESAMVAYTNVASLTRLVGEFSCCISCSVDSRCVVGDADTTSVSAAEMSTLAVGSPFSS